MRIVSIVRIAIAVALLASTNAAQAAEIRVLFPAGLKAVTNIVVPQFEKSTDHRVVLSYANIGTITDRVRKREPADMAVVSPQQWESLRKEGLFSPDVRVRIAHVAVGLAVKKGASKLAVGSNDELKAVLLSANSVGISNPAGGGTTGEVALHAFDRLRIAADMREKTKLVKDTAELLRRVARGEIDIGISPVSFIVQSPDVDLAGVLPGELQIYTEFVAGIPTYAQQPAAAQALIGFLRSSAAEPVFKAMGAIPG
jgi:molybdate transport system substrate-binding protein